MTKYVLLTHYDFVFVQARAESHSYTELSRATMLYYGGNKSPNRFKYLAQALTLNIKEKCTCTKRTEVLGTTGPNICWLRISWSSLTCLICSFTLATSSSVSDTSSGSTSWVSRMLLACPGVCCPD